MITTPPEQLRNVAVFAVNTLMDAFPENEEGQDKILLEVTGSLLNLSVEPFVPEDESDAYLSAALFLTSRIILAQPDTVEANPNPHIDGVL